VTHHFFSQQKTNRSGTDQNTVNPAGDESR
jgi:hypothetical protein